MNEEQSEKLLEVLNNINENIKSLSRERILLDEKSIMKKRIDNFIKANKDLKEYDIKYLEQILNEEEIGIGYILLKSNFERKGGNYGK